jgi:hypothetical protein
MARLRHADVPCESPLFGEGRKWLAEGQTGAIDPGCVKTPSSNFRVELLSRLR